MIPEVQDEEEEASRQAQKFNWTAKFQKLSFILALTIQ
jgi:hypothetical protein